MNLIENSSSVTRPSSLALIGSNGMLARMVRTVAPADYRIVPFDLPEFDLTDEKLVNRVLGVLQPEIIINCAAYTQVDACESEQDLAFRVNGEGPGILARAALAIGATLVHISTDYVFDGQHDKPYTEEDRTAPQSVYGQSKLQGEREIVHSGLQRYFMVRTSWLFGPGGKNFVETMIRLAGEREELRVVADQIGSPTMTRDLADALFRLLRTDAYGLYHFAGEGQCSWHQFTLAIIELMQSTGHHPLVKQVVPIATADFPLPAKRPAYSVFCKDKYRMATGVAIPDWRESLAEYFNMRAQPCQEGV